MARRVRRIGEEEDVPGLELAVGPLDELLGQRPAEGDPIPPPGIVRPVLVRDAELAGDEDEEPEAIDPSSAPAMPEPDALKLERRGDDVRPGDHADPPGFA